MSEEEARLVGYAVGLQKVYGDRWLQSDKAVRVFVCVCVYQAGCMDMSGDYLTVPDARLGCDTADF